MSRFSVRIINGTQVISAGVRLNDAQALAAGIEPAFFIGPVGPAPVFAIGTVEYGDEPAATITGTPEEPVLNLVLPRGLRGLIGEQGPVGETGERGPTGNGIASFARTSGTGAPGTTDVYTLTMTDGQTATVQVYNGRDGEGAGDMQMDVYDPDHNGIFEIDKVNGLQNALDNKSPIGHGHSISSVSGLQTALDNKSPSGHGHNISDVSGLQAALDAKAVAATQVAVTILSTAWQGSAAPYTATVAVEGVTPTTKGDIGLASSATAAEREAARAAMIAPTGTGNGQVYLVADGDKPAIDLPAVVTILG